VIASLIARRLLVNYRLEPGAAARVLPPGMRPLLSHGHAVGGICLIRLAGIRPAALPGLAGRFGLRTENAAHRIAVVWDGPDGPEHGVYIPRRDTDSRITTLTAGLFLPGEHHRARFEVRETADRLRIGFRSADGSAHAAVEATVTDRLRGSSLFADLEEASAFFRDAPDGYAARSDGDRLDGVRLQTREWSVTPAALVRVSSSYFEDPERFPAGTAEPDSALLMRDLEALWHPRPARSAHRPARPAVHSV
jgi:hypothetical protein